MSERKEARNFLLTSKDLITSDDILGKDVLDVRGQYIGVVTQLHIGKSGKIISGISIDTGFMKPQIFVGISMIINFGIDAVYISHTPRSKYLDLMVFDRIGVYLGKVKKVHFTPEKAIVQSIKVEFGFFKKVDVPINLIKVLGRNIILNIEKGSFLDLYHKSKIKHH